ncbi:UNVERIFIED_CONTAM: Retrovirus-related Pol polyprotein from transposon RE1, partial [Sesamum indicum]
MVRSMMSFTELPLSFLGYSLETAAKLLNMAPSKVVPQTPYEIWHDKPASYKNLRVWGSPTYVERLARDKLESTSSLCLTSQLDGNLITYGEAISHIHSNKWPEAMNPKWTLWVQTKFGPWSTHIKALSQLVAYGSTNVSLELTGRLLPSRLGSWKKGYTQQPEVDFEEIYSPVAMAKSIRILLVIAAWYDYEMIHMDVKTNFLNGSIEKRDLHRSVGRFHLCWRRLKVIRAYDIIKNESDPCVYNKISRSSVAYLVLYVDNILLIGNDVK